MKPVDIASIFHICKQKSSATVQIDKIIMQNISNQSLIKTSSFIHGQWLGSEHTFDVINPATQESIASISEINSFQLERAIISAFDALSTWQNLSNAIRAEKLNRWQELMRDNVDDLARLLTLEQGKPFREARGEILHAANYMKLYSELSTDLEMSRKVGASIDQIAHVFRRPIGVVTAITPWNFPCAMVLRKAAAAMAAGCTVVLKPSESTPLSALALTQLSVDAGIPAGVFNVVVGSNAQSIGEILTQHTKVAKFSFTGSTKVGKKLLQQCASGIKRTSMELGGNAPFIVFEDADLDVAVDGAIASKFRNAGQTCVTANRFLIHKDVMQDFISRLIDKTKELNIGNGFEPSTDLGPLINSLAIDKMNRLIDKALTEGAELLLGGKRNFQENGEQAKGYFFQPTILKSITPDMEIFNREIFGPIVVITNFENDSQAIELANQTELGLCAYVYTQNQQRISNIAAKLQVGMLGINEARLSNPAAPFGGIKQSGMGREGGHYGIEEYLDYQYVCIKE